MDGEIRVLRLRVYVEVGCVVGEKRLRWAPRCSRSRMDPLFAGTGGGVLRT